MYQTPSQGPSSLNLQPNITENFDLLLNLTSCDPEVKPWSPKPSAYITLLNSGPRSWKKVTESPLAPKQRQRDEVRLVQVVFADEDCIGIGRFTGPSGLHD